MTAAADPEANAEIDRLCPKCERVPDGPGALCPACGCRLVELTPDSGLIGTVVDGRFEIRGLLGEGGMGTVYRAWQRSVGREIAIKVIDRKKVRDAMTVRRFLREAKLASQLAHPNTVSVIDFGQAEDRRLFIAMELVRGRTLADAVAQDGALGLARALAVGIQLCDALEAAHGLSIVHRDLKPANVILVDDPNGRDRIKVLDFGLAKSLTADDSESTQTGDVVGTPRYLAPELAAGDAATPQSDLYAVGVMLVELCTGRRLFDGLRMVDMMVQKACDPKVPDDVPPALAAIVLQLLAPEPALRPASAAALRAMLVSCQGGAADMVTPPPMARSTARHEPRAPREPTEATRATGPVRFTGSPAAPAVAAVVTAVAPAVAPPRQRGRLVAGLLVVGAALAVAFVLVPAGGRPATPQTPVPAPAIAAPATAPPVDASVPTPDAGVPAPRVEPIAPTATSTRASGRPRPAHVERRPTPTAPAATTPATPPAATTPDEELPF